MLSILARFIPSVIPILGKLGKGKGTLTGDIVTGVGAAIAGAPHVSVIFGVAITPEVVALAHEIGLIVAAFGTVIAAFGFGRKAGAHVDPE